MDAAGAEAACDRRDAVRVLRAIAARPWMLPTACRGFDRPALVVWATDDRVMPREHGRLLAELLPQDGWSMDDSYTLIHSTSRRGSPRPSGSSPLHPTGPSRTARIVDLVRVAVSYLSTALVLRAEEASRSRIHR
jgi:hypothetical protein